MCNSDFTPTNHGDLLDFLTALLMAACQCDGAPERDAVPGGGPDGQIPE